MAECTSAPALAVGPGALSAKAPDALSPEVAGPNAIAAPVAGTERPGAKARGGGQGQRAKRAVQANTLPGETVKMAATTGEDSVFERITAQLLRTDKAD